jgi:hypothetical protein
VGGEEPVVGKQRWEELQRLKAAGIDAQVMTTRVERQAGFTWHFAK